MAAYADFVVQARKATSDLSLCKQMHYLVHGMRERSQVNTVWYFIISSTDVIYLSYVNTFES